MTHKSRTTKSIGLTALAATMTWGTIIGAGAQSQTRTVSLDAGSVIPVKLDNALSSKDARKGDTFTATIRNNADANYTQIPTGTHIEGVVRDVHAKKDNNPGVIDLEFRRIRMPDGRSVSIEGSLIGLDNKSVEKRSDGRLVASPGHRNDRLTYVGYGAGAGLLVGLLTKHGLEDTVIGGGLGYLFGSLQKGGQSQARDVALKEGTEVGVRLDRAVSLANYGSSDDYNNYRGRTDDSGRFHRVPAGNDTSYHYNGDKQGNNPNGQNSRAPRDNRHPSQDNITNRNTPEIGVLIGDRNVDFASTARPYMTKGVAMVPVRAALDAAHIPFTFDSATQEIRATGDGGTVRIAINSSIAVVNGSQRVRMEAPAQRLNGSVYVPMKFFSLVTGQDATYDAGSRTVLINLKGMNGNTDR